MMHTRPRGYARIGAYPASYNAATASDSERPHDEDLQQGLNPSDKAQRVANYATNLMPTSGYAIGGVPSALPTTASIWITASLGKTDTPMVLLAGTQPGNNSM